MINEDDTTLLLLFFCQF